MIKILARYAEIGLKGKNRIVFEKQLIKNISQQLNIKPSQVNISQKQIFITVSDSLINQSVKNLAKVFGLAWFAPVTEVKTDLSDISKATILLAKTQKASSFAIRASRINKTITFNSQDIAIKVGDQVRKTLDLKVDLTNPALEIYIVANKDTTYLFTQKISGVGGLPVGTSGKVLCLLSGGFDSIAASYLLAKRGAEVDFLHFHVFNDQKKVLNSKIKHIIDQLSQYTLSTNLYLASYTPYQMVILDLPNRQQKQELVVFRRLMVKVGQELAKKHGYQALVLGDSLGQVASQTMENIVAVDQAVNIPIFRPLIGMDKKDIIDLVRQIGLEKETEKPYKDCCSIISKAPSTKANLEKVEEIEEDINIDKIVQEIIQNI
ncbi:tRNA uracil 4-sulfurtransferase ThiI [Patescibacteria group bacterium]